MNRRDFVGLLCAAAAAACGGRAVADPAVPSYPRVLRRGTHSPVTVAKNIVARDQASYEAAWNQLFRGSPVGNKPGPPPPVDFRKEMVLVVFMGQRNTGGYSVSVPKVEALGGKLIVSVEEKSPAPDAILIQVLTAPYCLVAVPKSELPVEWTKVPPKPARPE